MGTTTRWTLREAMVLEERAVPSDLWARGTTTATKVRTTGCGHRALRKHGKRVPHWPLSRVRHTGQIGISFLCLTPTPTEMRAWRFSRKPSACQEMFAKMVGSTMDLCQQL